jgi:hypothetical protein
MELFHAMQQPSYGMIDIKDLLKAINKLIPLNRRKIVAVLFIAD